MKYLQSGGVLVLAPLQYFSIKLMRLTAKLHYQLELAPEKGVEIWALINVKF